MQRFEYKHRWKDCHVISYDTIWYHIVSYDISYTIITSYSIFWSTPSHYVMWRHMTWCDMSFTKTRRIYSHRTFPWWYHATLAQCAQAWWQSPPTSLRISAACQETGQQQALPPSPSRSLSIWCCPLHQLSQWCRTAQKPEGQPQTEVGPLGWPRKERTPAKDMIIGLWWF